MCLCLCLVCMCVTLCLCTVYMCACSVFVSVCCVCVSVCCVCVWVYVLCTYVCVIYMCLCVVYCVHVYRPEVMCMCMWCMCMCVYVVYMCVGQKSASELSFLRMLPRCASCFLSVHLNFTYYSARLAAILSLKDPQVSTTSVLRLQMRAIIPNISLWFSEYHSSL